MSTRMPIAPNLSFNREVSSDQGKSDKQGRPKPAWGEYRGMIPNIGPGGDRLAPNRHQPG
jgi:hypothetical protein